MGYAMSGFALFGGCMIIANLILRLSGLISSPLERDLLSIIFGDIFAALLLVGIFASWLLTLIGFGLLAVILFTYRARC